MNCLYFQNKRNNIKRENNLKRPNVNTSIKRCTHTDFVRHAIIRLVAQKRLRNANTQTEDCMPETVVNHVICKDIALRKKSLIPPIK